MSRVSRVIVGASGSPGSLPALRYALELARHHGAMLVALHAWTPPGGDFAERRSPCLELRHVWKEAARERLHDALAAAWGTESPHGITVRALVQRGEPGPVLVDATFPDDLLVIGTGRRGLLARILRGGRVSRYCLAHAACPVLAVPSPVPGHWHAWRHGHLTVDEVLRESRHPAA